MPMKHRAQFVAIACFATLTALAEPVRPNIIVIFTDDHGWADLGAQGVRKDIRTPHLDALAAGGLRAVSGYVTAPQCVPSRAGLLSGRYQNRFGVESNAESVAPFAAERTIAERLKEAGYVTGMAGKWHLGANDKITEHGIDKVFFKHSNAPGLWNMDLDGKDIEPVEQRGGAYHLDLIADFACAFIKRHASVPFFFYLAPRAPHTPLDAPPKYTSRFPGEMPERRRRALAMISAIDDGVGRILATLREHKLEERTLIFVMGDNGAPLKIHKVDSPLKGDPGGWDGSLNEPMNGEKGMLSEGGIRVPWLAYWKGTIPAGRVYPHPVISLDVTATALAMAGLPHDPVLDGVNLIPFFTGRNPTAPHEALYWRWSAQAAIREGRWKLLVGGSRSYLFDLEADPVEQRNRLGQHSEIAQRLRARLESWAAGLQPPGLTTKHMTTTWENYYDHYLDGKPVSEQPSASATDAGAADWIARNATAEVQGGALHIAPKPGGIQRPFLALSKMSIPGPATVTLSLRSPKGGAAGIAWRLDGQEGFVSNQTVAFDLAAAADWQERIVQLPARGTIIHLRLLLPDGVTDLRRLELKAATGKAAKQWSFDSTASRP